MQPASIGLIGLGIMGKKYILLHAISNALKPSSERVSMSTTSLGQTRTLCYIITSANKADSVNLWRSGQNLPMAAITSIKDDIVLLDQ